MLSSRPYIARGLYQWLLDNDLTPYIVVDAEQPGVVVPRQFVQNGQIVLNVGSTAVRDLFIGNDAVRFHARFSGQPMKVEVPIAALVAIYARENGMGMVFGHEPVLPGPEQDEAEGGGRAELTGVERDEERPQGDKRGADTPRKGKPSLRVIK